MSSFSGVAAIALPLIATLAFTIIIGWVFLVSRRRRTGHDVLGPRSAGLLVVAYLGNYCHRRRRRAAAVAD